MRIAQLAPPWITVPPAGYGGTEWVVQQLCDGLAASRSRGPPLRHRRLAHRRGAVRPVPRADARQDRRDALRRPPRLVRVRRHRGAADSTSCTTTRASSASPSAATWRRRWSTPSTAPSTRWRSASTSSSRGDVGYICISEYQRSMAPPGMDWAGLVYNAIAVEDWPFAPEKDDYLLAFGRVCEAKGFHPAIEAAKRRTAGSSWPACCRSRTATTSRSSVAPHIDGEQIVYEGEVSDQRKRELFAHAHAFLFPITWPEPFGLVMIEAMASGTPVVALRQGSVPEVVDDGVTGFVVRRRSRTSSRRSAASARSTRRLPPHRGAAVHGRAHGRRLRGDLPALPGQVKGAQARPRRSPRTSRPAASRRTVPSRSSCWATPPTRCASAPPPPSTVSSPARPTSATAATPAAASVPRAAGRTTWPPSAPSPPSSRACSSPQAPCGSTSATPTAANASSASPGASPSTSRDDQGWTLRNSVVWHKVKGGPDTSRDRLRNVHELLFHFVRQPKGYYYDADAVRRAPRAARVEDGAVVSGTGVRGVRYRRQIELSTSLDALEKAAALAALDRHARRGGRRPPRRLPHDHPRPPAGDALGRGGGVGPRARARGARLLRAALSPGRRQARRRLGHPARGHAGTRPALRALPRRPLPHPHPRHLPSGRRGARSLLRDGHGHAGRRPGWVAAPSASTWRRSTCAPAAAGRLRLAPAAARDRPVTSCTVRSAPVVASAGGSDGQQRSRDHAGGQHQRRDRRAPARARRRSEDASTPSKRRIETIEILEAILLALVAVADGAQRLSGGALRRRERPRVRHVLAAALESVREAPRVQPDRSPTTRGRSTRGSRRTSAGDEELKRMLGAPLHAGVRGGVPGLDRAGSAATRSPRRSRA